jgi:site-specific DNA recombinase
MSPKKIAAPLDIYVRVSDVRGRSGDSFISPKDQEERCRALAKARGYQVGEVFTDLDVSGGKMKRPQLDQAIARIEEGVSAGIIVAKLDRFARTLVGGLGTLEQINELGGAVIVADGEFDTSTATGELVLNMMLSLAQFELRRIKEAWVGAKRHAVASGIHIAPRIPPGYIRGDDRKLSPDPVYGAVVTAAFARAAQGEKANKIAAFLTAEGLPLGGAPGVWESNRIGRLLANRVYLGEARNGHGDVNAEAHPPLVDKLTWNLAQRVPTGPTISNQETRLLAGICRCASCSYAMRSQSARGDTIAVYRCRTNSPSGRCPSPSTISEERLDAYVLEQFLARVADVTLHPVEDQDVFDQAATLANEAERKYRAVLADVALADQIGEADHRSMVAAYHTAWQEALAAVPTQKPSAPTTSVDIAALVAELQRREATSDLRELLASTIQAVFVRPAASRARNLPIEDRVHIVWTEDAPLTLPKRGERFEPRAFTWPSA